MKIIKWIFILLSLITVVALLTYSCVIWYADGINFKPGLHVFGYFLHIKLGVPVFLASLMVSMITVLYAKSLTPKGIFIAKTAIVVSIVIPFFSLPLMNASFSSGRERAYANVDCRRLANESRTLLSFLKNGESDLEDFMMECHYEKENLELLPEYIKSLKPLSIYIEKEAVSFSMDGGGIAGTEGMLVILEPDKFDLNIVTDQDGIEVLDLSFNVFRFEMDGIPTVKWSLSPAIKEGY